MQLGSNKLREGVEFETQEEPTTMVKSIGIQKEMTENCALKY